MGIRTHDRRAASACASYLMMVALRGPLIVTVVMFLDAIVHSPVTE